VSSQPVGWPGVNRATFPSGINNSGDVVGSYDDSQGNQHGFLYSGGVFSTIDPPGATTTLLGGINNNGVIAGTFCVSPVGNCQGFLLFNNHFLTISHPQSIGTQVLGLNDHTDLAADWDPSSGVEHDFIRAAASGQFIDFDLLNSSDTAAYGINNSGEIVGLVTNNGSFSGFYSSSTGASRAMQ
jgi:probable HAF family extracellular repeat protein